MDFVRMRHPDIEVLSEPVTREAFETVHRHKGWTIASDDEVAAADDEARLAEVTEPVPADTDTSSTKTTTKTKGS